MYYPKSVALEHEKILNAVAQNGLAFKFATGKKNQNSFFSSAVEQSKDESVSLTQRPAV